MPFDQLIRPTFAEARSTALQEGFLYGLIPGVVTSIDDPERIGRVQVESPVIEQGVNLPNSNDGWIPVMEPFVVNGSTGGQHSFLQVGSQVVMACLFGDPRQMIVVGSLPSRVDRPHPDLNRANGTYGSASPNDTVEAFRDTDSSAVISRPNGVLQTISGTGNFMVQTEARGRMQIQQDGAVRISNDHSHVNLSHEGEVSQRSAEGATAVLHRDGEVTIASSMSSRLRLDGGEGLLEGPLNELSQAIQEAKGFLGGTLGEAQGILGDLTELAQRVAPDSDVADFLADTGSVLEQLQNLSGSFEPGLSALRRIQAFSIDDLGQSLLPQVEALTGLGNLVEQVEPILDGSLTGQEIADQIIKLLPQGLAIAVPQAQLVSILDGLRHDQPMQLQAILGAIAPGGFGAIQNLVGLDLHRTLGRIQKIFSDFQSALNIPFFDAIEELLADSVRSLRGELPDHLRGLLSDNDLRGIVRADSTTESTQRLLGTVLGGLTRQVISGIERLQRQTEVLTPARDFVNAVTNGQETEQALGHLRELGIAVTPQLPPIETLQQVLPQVSQQLTPLVSSSLSSFNQLQNAIPSGTAGARVRASQTTAQMETHLGAAGAIAQVTPIMASLRSANGINEIFAGLGGAGISTPWGSLNLGGLGGSLLMKGVMAFRAFEDGGRSAGMRLDPTTGLSIASFTTGGQDADWVTPAARISVQDDVVVIESRVGGTTANRILVSPTGIFLNGVNISDLTQQIQSLLTRVAALEAAGTGGPTP